MTGFLRLITITLTMMMMVTMMIKERCGYWILGDTLFILGGDLSYRDFMENPPTINFSSYCFLRARYDTKNLQHGNYRTWRKVMSEGKQIACFVREKNA